MSNSEEKLDAIETETAAEETATEPDQAERASKRKRRSIVAGVVVAVVVQPPLALWYGTNNRASARLSATTPWIRICRRTKQRLVNRAPINGATKLPILPRCSPQCTARLAKPAWIATFPAGRADDRGHGMGF